jgi:hypothetical protein
MKLKEKSVIVCLLFFLIGCATPGPQMQVKRTFGEFDPKTRIYKNHDHNLQLTIPREWRVMVGKDLYQQNLVKQAESKGVEVLVAGSFGEYKGWVLFAFPWSNDIETFLMESDKNAPQSLVVYSKKEMRVGEIHMIERSLHSKERGWVYDRERAFIYNQLAYRLMIADNSPITDRDADILDNLSIGGLSLKLVDEKYIPLDKKFQLHEKHQTAVPIVTPSNPDIVTVTGTSANIRSGAGNEFSTVGAVKQGDKLTLIGEHGEWFNVRLENGQEGWINSRFVKER